jgi:hypothetical protein
MDITRIADTICERTDTEPQELLSNYAESVGEIDFEGFGNYCLCCGITITEDTLASLLANNEEYLFTESENGWTPTLLDKLELELAL